MTFPEKIVHAVIDQHVLREDRFGIEGQDSCPETMAGRLDVAITMVDPDDDFVV